MLSDEEREAIKNLRLNVTNVGFSVYDGTTSLFKMRDIQIVLNLIEKQSKEIEEAKQKEKKAYIDGTNVAHELCNKYWQDKIKAKIEEIDEVLKGQLIEKIRVYFEAQKEVLQSLLEKE